MLAAAGLVASCSTSKLAQSSSGDDVYNTVAKARAVEYVAPAPQQQQAQNNQEYDEYYGTSNPYYDMDYSSRINRFYNGSTFRGYYDPYYDNYYYGNSYGYNNYLGYGLNWSNGYGLGVGFGYGYGSIWNNPFYYGNMGWGMNNWGWNNWGWNSWGPYSYYDRFGWGGGFYGGGYGFGGGYYGGGIGGVYTNRNYRARPNRDGDNRGSYGAIGSRTAPVSGNYGRPSVSTNNAGRPERYNGSPAYGQAGNVSSRPSRDDNYRPQTQQAQPQSYSRPERSSYSPPPQSSGSSGSSSSSGSSGGGGGGGRPTRGGGR
ncbi:hypothetical protein O0931_06925 [Pedobacter sp. SJ11]|uniref:Prolyl-tRNA synthetase n=2 Tax=Pedobacter rhodius TaxID=3004098 RepID=A0ABT4KVR6_9SPHI|nr:hypothetical protein [Pedobacter sp. SJ11]